MEKDLLPAILCHLPFYLRLHYCWNYSPGYLPSRPETSDSECCSHINRISSGIGLRAQLPYVVAGAGLSPEFSEETPP